MIKLPRTRTPIDALFASPVPGTEAEVAAAISASAEIIRRGEDHMATMCRILDRNPAGALPRSEIVDSVARSARETVPDRTRELEEWLENRGM